MATLPWEAVVLDVTVRPVPASLANTEVADSAVLALVEPVSPVAEGVTVRLTVEVVVRPAASVAV